MVAVSRLLIGQCVFTKEDRTMHIKTRTGQPKQGLGNWLYYQELATGMTQFATYQRACLRRDIAALRKG